MNRSDVRRMISMLETDIEILDQEIRNRKFFPEYEMRFLVLRIGICYGYVNVIRSHI